MKPLRWNNSLSKSLLFNSSLVLVLLFVSLVGLFLWLEQIDYRRNIEQIKSDFMKQNRERVKLEVNDVLEYVQFRDNGLLERTKEVVKDRVVNASAIIEHLYSDMSPVTADKEILHEIVETVRLLNLDRTSDYIFINSLEGENLLYPPNSKLEGTNLLKSNDTNEVQVIRTLIKKARTNGTGFTTYKWPLPGSPESLHDKVTYLEVFEPLSLFIGSGEYLMHIEEEIQQETLNWISKLRFGNEGYIFVIDSSGYMLSHIDDEYNRRNLLDYRDPEGFPVVQSIIDTAISDSEGGYVEYLWEKPSTGIQAPKLSFVKYYHNWGWVFGGGVYLDALQKQIDEKLEYYHNRTWSRIAVLLALFGCAAILSLILVLIMTRKVERSLRLFADFFQNAVRTYTHIDPHSLRYREFTQIAEYANKMVSEYNRSRRQIESSLLEKETLLKEVHHRVKNNLQLISSILNLQSTHLKDDTLLQYFKESQSRIFTIASVHEELYKSENFQKIDLNAYINRIVPDLVHLYSEDTLIEYELHVDEIFVKLSLAIPLGLIINELITNSIQHAFPHYQSGQIVVSCTRNGNEINFVIRDNGIGISDKHQQDNPQTLGIQLIDTLVQQIHGHYYIKNENGCLFHLRIPFQSNGT